MNEAAENTAFGAILAGGRGARMDRPKPSAVLAGRMLIEYPLAAFASAGIEAVVVAKPASEIPELAVEVWRERPGLAHPLVGIVAALERARRPIVVCACDMPFVSAALLSRLAESEAPLVVPEFAGRLHPLVGRYDPSLLSTMREALAAERPLAAVVDATASELLDERTLRELGEPERMLFNVNTQQDLEQAEVLMRSEGPSG